MHCRLAFRLIWQTLFINWQWLFPGESYSIWQKNNQLNCWLVRCHIRPQTLYPIASCGSLNGSGSQKFIGSSTVWRPDFFEVGVTLLKAVFTSGGGLWGLTYAQTTPRVSVYFLLLSDQDVRALWLLLLYHVCLHAILLLTIMMNGTSKL